MDLFDALLQSVTVTRIWSQHTEKCPCLQTEPKIFSSLHVPVTNELCCRKWLNHSIRSGHEPKPNFVPTCRSSSPKTLKTQSERSSSHFSSGGFLKCFKEKPYSQTNQEVVLCAKMNKLYDFFLSSPPSFCRCSTAGSLHSVFHAHLSLFHVCLVPHHLLFVSLWLSNSKIDVRPWKARALRLRSLERRWSPAWRAPGLLVPQVHYR